MGDNNYYEYSLDSEEGEQILRMALEKKRIAFAIEKKEGQIFVALITLDQLKNVCVAFETSSSLNEAIEILHNTIEGGRIYLTEDEQGSSIEIKFLIKMNNVDYPPFAIILSLENEESLDEEKKEEEEEKVDTLPEKFDYAGNVEAEQKYGKSKENTTEYSKPIIQPNYKKPIVELEFIEPILHVHYPDGTTKITHLQPRIQTSNGQIADIDDKQFKMIQEQMNLYMANKENNVNDGNFESSKYSVQTVPIKNLVPYLPENNEGGESKYSTFTVPAKPIIYPEEKMDNNDQFNMYSQDNNIIEYGPNMNNQNNEIYDNSNNYTNNYENNYTNNYSNYEYQQQGYTNQNTYDMNQVYSNNTDYNYQNYQNQNFENYNNNYSDFSNTQSFPQQFEQAFAEVIPLNPINEYLQGQTNKNQGNNNEITENQTEDGQQNDIEKLFRTEKGLIIFRNGLLKGIIQKYSEIDEVVSKIQDKLLKGAKFILLYKASIDGDKAKVFHEKCDKHKMTLVLVETTKGVRFGGFTTKSWEGHCTKKIDNNAFVFSIDKNKIFDIVRNEPAIGCYPKFGPVFFGCQIRVFDNFFTKGGTTCYRGLNYKTRNDFELNNGEQTYIIKDIEVYDIVPIDI